MNTVVIVAMVLAMLGTLGALGFGLANMVRGKDLSGRTSNKWMWRRIYFQAAALALFAILLLMAKQ